MLANTAEATVATATTATIEDHIHEIVIEEARHLANDTHLPRMVNHKQDTHIAQLAPLLTMILGRSVQELT